MLKYFPKRIFIFGFSLFIIITLLLLAINLFYIKQEILFEAQGHAKKIAMHLNFEMFENYDFDMDDFWKKDKSDSFNQYVLRGIKTLGLESIKIYNKDGWIIYSDRYELIGIKPPGNENFKKALGNTPTSFVASAEYYKRIYGIPIEKDMIETYIPIYDESGKNIIGVFEIYQDYSPLTTAAYNTMKRAAIIIISLMSFFSILLFILVRRGNIIIAAERERLVDELEHTVENRTKALKDSESRYKTFLDNVTDSVVVVDLFGKFISVNNKFLAITGYSLQEINEINFLDLINKENLDSLNKYYLQLLNNESVSCEVDIISKNGERIPHEIKGNKLLHEGKEMIMGLGRDIRERRKLEEFKNDFYSMITHDFRVPLTPILGFAEILLKSEDPELTQLNDKSANIVSIILKNAKRLNKLIDDFLLTSKIESDKIRLVKIDIDIQNMIEMVIDNYKVKAQAGGIKIITGFNTENIVIKADINQLERVLSNFLSNAIKYNEPGGEVIITTKKIDDYGEPGGVKIDIFNSFGYIREETLPHIFDKYRRDEKSREIEGTGLGLYIAKSIADLHGGRIDVKSEKGVGTTFSLILPLKGSSKGLGFRV